MNRELEKLVLQASAVRAACPFGLVIGTGFVEPAGWQELWRGLLDSPPAMVFRWRSSRAGAAELAAAAAAEADTAAAAAEVAAEAAGAEAKAAAVVAAGSAALTAAVLAAAVVAAVVVAGSAVAATVVVVVIVGAVIPLKSIKLQLPPDSSSPQQMPVPAAGRSARNALLVE